MTTGRRSRGGFSPRVFGNRPRRQLKWATDNINASIVSSGTPLLSQLNAVLATSQEEQSTLVRTILCLTVLPVTPAVGLDSMLFSLGVGVAGRDAFAAGAASVPSPAVPSEEPIQGWLYQCMYWILERAGADHTPLLIEKDIRTSRRIGNGVPFIRADNDPGAGTPFTVRIVGVVRSLYMLA